MTVTATRLFEFLDRHPTCEIEKYDLHSAAFSSLRRNIRAIISRLYEGEETNSQEVADSMRTSLSEWLTVPVCFDDTVLESISSLGEPSAVEMKWGRDVRVAYDFAYRAATELQKEENPARAQIKAIIEKLHAEGRRWKIYCHSRATVHFQSMLPQGSSALDFFLHSVRDYREVAPFDVLLKMGPLRSRGWGSAPDALLSAPRFATLIQVIWSGCADEEGFGYDPALVNVSSGTTTQTKASTQTGTAARISWKKHVIQVGDPTSDIADSNLDDLAFFGELSRGTAMRRATLIQIDDEHGILYPPHSQVPTFDPAPAASDPVGYTLPGETLLEGMFVIVPILGAADFGGMHSSEGHYSRIWKSRLIERRQHAPNDLVRRLREGGIQLRNLAQRVQQWCRPASSVIHAPQTSHHFEILIRVLGIDHEAQPTSRSPRHAWWEYAWAEIARSRGEAIQSAMQEHEIVYEELFGILNDILPTIRSRAVNHDFVELEMPANKPLQGVVRFYKVRSLEEGFLVPDTMLKVIWDLDTVEQWRA